MRLSAEDLDERRTQPELLTDLPGLSNHADWLHRNPRETGRRSRCEDGFVGGDGSGGLVDGGGE